MSRAAAAAVMADETFESADSVASMTVPVQAGNLKKGDFICINGFPCKLVDISTSKTGKHGHAKANITALDVFTGKKYEEVAPTSHNLPQPVVKTANYILMDVQQDGHLSLLDESYNQRCDLVLPADEEIAAGLQQAFDEGKEVTVTVMAAMGKECVMSFKVPQT
jgi:translation initiation factor 5A